MQYNSHNVLYVIWKDPRSRRNYIVGKLTKSDHYSFEYCEDYKKAQDAGWLLLEAFPDEKVYESKELFAAFSGRLPDPKRRGIDKILKKYGLNEYDGFELLRKSTGRLPIDTYEFIDPIFPDDETVMREFYVMGIRHLSGCDGLECAKRPDLVVGDSLKLEKEPENDSDPFAVKVLTQESEMLGYIPRYYSKSVSSRLSSGMTYSCTVVEISSDMLCESCVKVRLVMPKLRED